MKTEAKKAMRNSALPVPPVTKSPTHSATSPHSLVQPSITNVTVEVLLVALDILASLN